MRLNVWADALGFAAVMLACTAPAAAEEWVSYRSRGEAPARQVFLIDRVNIGSPRQEPSTIRLAILSEPGHSWAAQTIFDLEISCASGTGKITQGEVRDADGILLRVVDGQPYGGLLSDSPYGAALEELVCQNIWPVPTTSYEHHSLPEIYAKVFTSGK